MDFLILEGGDYVFFGQFETLTPDEISDRLTLLSRGLSEFKKRFETVFKNTWTLENIELAYRVWAKLKIEAIISKDIDISEVLSVVQEKAIPITLIKRNMII
jgi:hypothetical protein